MLDVLAVVTTAVMPKGVEHQQLRDFPNGQYDVTTAVMPKGVEHAR